MTGGESYEDLITIRNQVTTILNSAGFNLTKWSSNHPKFISTLRRERGLHWSPKNDSLKFHLENSFKDFKATKRNILSVSSRLFDSLGLLCPISIKSKVLLQELWIQKLDWDESIPMNLDTSWENLKSHLMEIDSIVMPRFVQTTSTATI